MKNILKLILILFCSSAFADEQNYNQPMVFNNSWSGGNAQEASWISAIGVIEKDTPKKFKEFIEKESPETTKIVLHSPGGDLVAGIELGREIRKLGLNTFIGDRVKNQDDFYDGKTGEEIENPHDAFGVGKCLSACAYAFLGGLERVVNTNSKWGEFYQGMHNSKIGFHKFYNDTKINKALSANHASILINFSMSKAQFITGYIVSYMIEMGIDANFIFTIGKHESNEIIYFTDDILKDFKVISDRGYGAWSMTPYKNNILTYSLNNGNSYAYNKAEKIGFFCSSANNLPILVIDSFKSKKLLNISNSKPYNRVVYLTLDGNEHKILGNKVRDIDLDSIYIQLNKKIINLILSSESIRAEVVVPRVEGGFSTPNILINDIERKMIRLSLKNCT